MESTGSNIPIKQNSAQRLFKVFPETGHDFFKDVHAGAVWFPVPLFMLEIIVENSVYGLTMRERNELIVLGNILPVVYQHRLNMIWHGQMYHRFIVKGIFLFSGLVIELKIYR